MKVMNIENANDKQNFGLKNYRLPETEIGNRINRIIPRLEEITDKETHLVVSNHGDTYGVFFGRPHSPFYVQHTDKGMGHYEEIKVADLPKDDEGMLSLMQKILIKAQNGFLAEYTELAKGVQKTIEGLSGKLFKNK